MDKKHWAKLLAERQKNVLRKKGKTLRIAKSSGTTIGSISGNIASVGKHRVEAVQKQPIMSVKRLIRTLKPNERHTMKPTSMTQNRRSFAANMTVLLLLSVPGNA